MFSKRRLTAACLLVLMTAFVAWAAVWQIQTKLATAGGTIQVTGKAVQSTAGSLIYNSMADTLASADVTVTANAGYEIASVTKNGVAVAGVAGLPATTVTFNKSVTTQSLIASFKAKQLSVTGAADGPGSLTPTAASVNAGGSVNFAASPATLSTAITAITVNGSAFTGIALPATGNKTFTVSNISAPTAVVVTFVTATANAGAAKVVVYNAPVTLDGSASGPGTIAWTQTSGPAVTLTNADTATPSFTPTVAGTYGFKLAKMNGTAVLASSTTTVTAVTDLVSYMESSCNGCHNPNGMVASNALNQWKVSKHLTVASITCTTCHTDGGMPSPVSTSSVDPNSFTVLTANGGTVGTIYCDQCHAGNRTVVHSTDAALVAVDVCSKCHDPHFFNDNGTHHFAGLPSTGGYVDGTQRTQYFSQGATCADCHNAASNYINKGYAEGGHGHVSAEALNAFTHYDWSARTNNGTRQNGNCDRCHTTGGFVKLLGDATAAAKFAPQAGVQNVLGCSACHSDFATGALRIDATPAGNGQTLAQGYFALFSSAASAVPADKTKIQIAFPGMKNSSICVPCHSGRSTDKVFMAVVDKAATPVAGVYGNYSTLQTSYYQHAANMGQTFIGTGAYNFGGNAYVGANGHAAVKNDVADTQGPCVGCHHSSADSHSLAVTGYTSCQACHAAGFGATDVEAAAAKFEAGVKVLDALIKQKFEPLRGDLTKPLSEERAYIRFGKFGTRTKTLPGEVEAEIATLAKNGYGAWYNWQILATYDKAAFVHNPTYARQILLETIDYVDNAKIDGSAEATIEASTAVTAAEKEEAVAFATIPACASCHAAKTTLVQSGKHMAEISTHSGTCGRCHTTEGYVAFLATGKSPTGNFTKTALTGNPSDTGLDQAYNGTQNVSCSACHDSHGTVRNVAWAPQPAGTSVAASAEYKLCTSCHNLTDASGNVMASGLSVNGDATVAMQQHYKDWYRNIASTHYDAVATGTVTNVGTLIEGYNVRYNSATACTDCHGHNFYTNSAKALEAPSATDADKGKGTVQTEWAASGHAGKILSVKFTAFTTANAARNRTATTHQAVMQAGVTAATGQAWEHYDWDDMASRASCQKCHTATGAANFLNNPAGYVAANNNFDHLSGWTANKKSPQNEVLYCWGCHNNAETGALRDPGALTLDYNFKGVKAVLPAVGASDVCFACHSGRTGGENITALTTAGNTFTNVSFVNSHYMAAAGLMYAKIGYTNFVPATTVIGTSTYGKSLTTPEDGGSLTSTHRKLGTAAIIGDHGIVAEDGLDAGGPCAACHYAKGTHELEIGKVAFESVCVKCHEEEAGIPLTAANFKEIFIEEQAVPFKDAIALAVAKLNANYKIVYNPALNPYFFEQDGVTAVKDWTRAGKVATALTAADAEKLMGACFNINVLQRDPAAYAHARTYTRRLLFDSIDFLDDGAINLSTPATALAFNPAKYVKGVTALSFNTSEGYKYLAAYDRTTGAWKTPVRP